MAIYEYRCSDCGTFDRSMPMGTAPESARCPTCGRESHRVFSVPMTYRTPDRLAAMFAREEASRDQPEVVNRVPPKARPARPGSAASSPEVRARLPKL